jgi:hypothetical protein
MGTRHVYWILTGPSFAVCPVQVLYGFTVTSARSVQQFNDDIYIVLLLLYLSASVMTFLRCPSLVMACSSLSLSAFFFCFRDQANMRMEWSEWNGMEWYGYICNGKIMIGCGAKNNGIFSPRASSASGTKPTR